MSLNDDEQIFLASTADAVKMLVGCGLLSDENVTVIGEVRRNRNFRVTRADGSGYLIKQADDPLVGNQLTLQNESAFYATCKANSSFEPVRELLPNMAYFDAQRGIIALDLIAAATPFWEPFFCRDSQPPPKRLLVSWVPRSRECIGRFRDLRPHLMKT
jgi:hypothetical protein